MDGSSTIPTTRMFWRDQAWRSRWFRRVWVAALVLLVLNLGHNLGLGNINPVERSFFLVAMGLFVWGRPLRPLAVTGVLLIVTAIVVAAVGTDFSAFEWRRTAMALVALITMLGFLSVRSDERDTVFLLRSISVLPLAMLALGVLLYLLVGRELMVPDHTGAHRLGGATGPAFLAAACYAAAVASGLLFSRKASWTDAFLIAAALAISALSGTRMATACAGASALACLLVSRQSGVFKTLVVVYGLAAAALFLLTVGDQIVVRFLSGSSSGRDVIAQHLVAAAHEHPWFGVGYGHHGLLIPELVQRYTGTSAAHNEFLRLRLELGWVGLTLFGTGWVLLWAASLSRFVRPTLALLALLAVFSLYSSTDNTLFFVSCLLGLIAVGTGLQLMEADQAKRSGSWH